MSEIKKTNAALDANQDHRSAIENAADYIENFDILETITNVGNDEVFTPRKICEEMLNSLPDEVWHNPDLKWLNPCTKNGIFEREIALRLDKGLTEVIPDQEERRKHILQKMIYSIGLTKFTAHVARRTLYYCTAANRKCDGKKAEDGTHYVNGYAIGNGHWFDDSEGNIKSPTTEHCFEGTGKIKRCKYCGIKNDSMYVDPLQREQYAYEFIHVYHSFALEKHLQTRFFGGNRNMKFDIIIGNPPYQLRDESGGASDSAVPIYNKFIDQAISLNPRYLCMIVPSKWMVGGRGLDSFREEMVNDKHLRLLVDYENSKECFPTNNIDGGVCYFVWDRNYNGLTHHVYKCENGDEIVANHSLKNSYSPYVIRNTRIVDLLDKFKSEQKFSSIVSSVRPYGIRGYLFNEPERYPNSGLQDKQFDNSLKIYGVKGIKGGAKRMIGYVKNSFITGEYRADIDLWKIFFTTSYSTNAVNFPEPIMGMPGEICTETFLRIGPFKTETEQKNCLSYIHTKFFKFLLYHGKGTMHVTKDVFSLIPLVDFKEPWTDEKLIAKFNLSDDDIKLIQNLGA